MNELLAPDAADNTHKRYRKGYFEFGRYTMNAEANEKQGHTAYKGYRQIFVRNYVIIYKVFPIKKEVHIVTVRYVHSQF